MELAAEEWILNCKQDELLVDGKCIPLKDVEREIKSLLRKRDRSGAENLRLATIHDAMKNYLETLNEMEKQVKSQQSYYSSMVSYIKPVLSWWSSSPINSGGNNCSNETSSGLSATRSYRRKNSIRTRRKHSSSRRHRKTRSRRTYNTHRSRK